jgi:hypothetical protein
MLETSKKMLPLLNTLSCTKKFCCRSLKFVNTLCKEIKQTLFAVFVYIHMKEIKQTLFADKELERREL